MKIVFYISGHGFGHASRDIEVINAIARRRPDAEFVVRTSVPRWLFSTVLAPIDVQSAVADTGLAQLDSLRFDEQISAKEARRFYSDFERRVADEASALRAIGPTLVVGDIPPLAFAAAKRAGLPSVAIGNFTWDWIYGAYPSFSDVVPIIQEAYANADRALRLPFHGGFEPMASATMDLPLIARRSRRGPADTRRLLGVPDQRPLVLSSFGGYGGAIPIERVTASASFTFLAFERHPPHGLNYQDVVAAADVVVSKPGYGIVSECIANDTALLYTSRGRFIEYDVMVAEMAPLLRARFIPQTDLLEGRWDEAIAALLAQEPPRERPRIDGAESAARAILDML